MTATMTTFFPSWMIWKAGRSMNAFVLLWIAAIPVYLCRVTLSAVRVVLLAPFIAFLRVLRGRDPSILTEAWTGLIAVSLGGWLLMGRKAPWVHTVFSSSIFPEWIWIVLIGGMGAAQIIAVATNSREGRALSTAAACFFWFWLLGLFTIYGGLTFAHPFLFGVDGACFSSVLLLRSNGHHGQPSTSRQQAST